MVGQWWLWHNPLTASPSLQRHSPLQSSSCRQANIHRHTAPERGSSPQGWWAHFADKGSRRALEFGWVPDSRRSKSKLTSYGVKEAPSSHSQDQPSHWEHPATGQGGERGWRCSFGRDRLELDFCQGQPLEAQRPALCLPSPTARLYGACGLDRLLVTMDIFLQASVLKHVPEWT